MRDHWGGGWLRKSQVGYFTDWVRQVAGRGGSGWIAAETDEDQNEREKAEEGGENGRHILMYNSGENICV